MRTIDLITSRLWAITPELLEQIRSAALEVDPALASADFSGNVCGSATEKDGPVAVIPIKGVIVKEPTLLAQIITALFGGTILSSFEGQFRVALTDCSVKSIALDVHSPGGEAAGIEAAAQLIASARGVKPVVAFVNGMAASAAYWLASAADMIVLSGESSQVGSIGTVLGMQDARERDAKAGIKQHEIVSSQSPKKRPDPATDEGLAELKAYADQFAQVFIEAVARNRGVSVEKVLSDFGQGGILFAQSAISAGMADSISSRQEMMGAMKAGRMPGKGMQGFGGSAANFNAKGGSMDPVKTAEQWAAEIEAAKVAAKAEGKSEGICEGRKLERARVSAILNHDAAKGRQNLARTMALETDLDAEAVAKLLTSSPVETVVRNPLAAAMEGVKNPNIGAGAGEPDDDKSEVARIVALHKSAKGGK
jgi:capsid assembly protease